MRKRALRGLSLSPTIIAAVLDVKSQLIPLD